MCTSEDKELFFCTGNNSIFTKTKFHGKYLCYLCYGTLKNQPSRSFALLMLSGAPFWKSLKLNFHINVQGLLRRVQMIPEHFLFHLSLMNIPWKKINNFIISLVLLHPLPAIDSNVSRTGLGFFKVPIRLIGSWTVQICCAFQTKVHRHSIYLHHIFRSLPAQNGRVNLR